MKQGSVQTKLQHIVILLLSLMVISACRLGQSFIPMSTPTSMLTAATPIGGELLAFLSAPHLNICFIHVNGSTKTCLDVKASDQPAWSPNAERLVFYSSSEEASGLYMVSPDGSNIAKMTQITELDRDPSWSPDGNQIAFSGTNGIVYVMSADGTNITRQTNADCMYPSWSPDGKYIAVAGTNTGTSDSSGCNFSGIYIMNADGSNKMLVTKLPNGYVYDIAWSPDGRYIAFTSNMDALPNAKWSYRDIYSIDIDGFKVTRLTNNGNGGSTLSWSPDSKHIAFDHYNSEEHKWFICIMNADGSNVSILTEGLFPAWQP